MASGGQGFPNKENTMSDDSSGPKKWVPAGIALAGLAVVSPPAAGVAAIVLGVQECVEYFHSRKEKGSGPVEG